MSPVTAVPTASLPAAAMFATSSRSLVRLGLGRTVMGNSPIKLSPFLLHGLYSVPLYIPLPWLGFSGNIEHPRILDHAKLPRVISVEIRQSPTAPAQDDVSPYPTRGLVPHCQPSSPSRATPTPTCISFPSPRRAETPLQSP